MKVPIWKFGVLCGLLGAAIAGVLTCGWYSPLVFQNPRYTELLTILSNIFWPTARMMGGGAFDPVTFWLRVTRSIIANAIVYSCVGVVGLLLMRRLKGH